MGILHRIVFILILVGNAFMIQAQTTIRVQGIVRDGSSKEPIPFVSVAIKGTKIGVQTDLMGRFSMRTTTEGDTLQVTSVGYKEKLIKLSRSRLNDLTIDMDFESYQLKETVIRPKKGKYSRKNNPAVDFIKRMIDQRDENDPRNKPFYSYNQYEGITLALNDFTEEVQKKWLFRKFNFLHEFVDTSEVSGKPILPMLDKEKYEKIYFRNDPRKERRVVTATKSAGVDEVLNEQGVKQFLEEVFNEVDIFQNNIPLFLTRFVSPLSKMGPYFYKYYLMDTVMVGGKECIDLGFIPYNSESFGFTGHLYFTKDSANFLKRIVLNIPKDININFLDRMTITQDFDQMPDNTRLLIKDDIIAEFRLTSKSRGMYARRISTLSNHSFEPPGDMSVFEETRQVVEEPDASDKSDEFWAEIRYDKGKNEKKSMGDLMERLRSVPVFYYTEKVVSAFIGGYVPTAKDEKDSRFEFGPVNTFISGNSLEGTRFRLGGTTTTVLAPNFFLDGFAAYGTRDKKLKYDVLAEYSFNKKKQFRKAFPVHSIRAEYSYDVNQLGQQYLYTNKDNLFLMLKRKENNMMTYLRKAELAYTYENYHGWRFETSLRHQVESASKFIPFNEIQADGTTLPVKNYTSSEMEFRVRWAPNEKFYETRNYRYPITQDAPVFTFSHVVGLKGFLGSQYNYNRTDIGIQKRIWLPAAGYIDAIAKAGKVWTKAPFPMLVLPNANLSYTVQLESYALLNPLEFINDQYLSWDITYYMNGTLLNRIPLLKYLQFREVINFKGFWGDLSNKNNPAKGHKGLFVFPENTFLMNNDPYMEISAGISNILKFLRIDYVWRLSYRNHEGSPNHGLRFRLEFNF